MPDDVDYGYHNQDFGPSEPVYVPCCDECDGVTGEDTDPEYYCKAGNLWGDHEEADQG